VENHVCLSHCVQVASAAWWAATRIVAGVEDLVQRTRDGCTGQVLDGRTIGKSGDIVCGLHRACGYEERRFLGRVSKPRSTVCQWFSLKTTGMVCQWFGLKTTRTVSPDLASKPAATISFGLASKPVVEDFPVWSSKPAAMVW
jgi:hypothetical protein